MPDLRHIHALRDIATRFIISLVMIFTCVCSSEEALAQDPPIDPRLIEIIDQVKVINAKPSEFELRGNQSEVSTNLQTEKFLAAIDLIQTASYSKNSKRLREAVNHFGEVPSVTEKHSRSRIFNLYYDHSDLLEQKASLPQQQSAIEDYILNGSWFERYIALSLSSQLHVQNGERQAALQKAQLAVAVIPTNLNEDAFVDYAKARVTSTIAQLHNLQGNTDLAIRTSLEYLRLTEEDPDPQANIDLINNLIFSHNMSRDHYALIYLSSQLLEIEKTGTSSVPGLSELRVSQVKNSVGRFDDGLDYALMSLSKVSMPQVKRQAQINKAIALTGLGRVEEAREAAREAGSNLTPEYLLSEEKSRDILYLSFLLAQTEDRDLATKLFNRQLDVTSQKFLANNSRDTTAMLADLENSRERQVEREAAAVREARLQELTIDRQRKLNRTLMLVSILLALATLAAVLFARYRNEITKELEIKTEQAASAEKLKTEFLGMISHELRTPLNAIIGISDYLTQYHNDPDIRKKSSIILQGGNDLFSVVESLTDMARIDAGQMDLDEEDTNLAAALIAIPPAWEADAVKKGLVFTHFIDPAIGSHFVDEKRLTQSINILLANAIRFTTAGRVHLHITANSDAAGRVSGLTAVVADTGRGMSELVQSRLFTPFMQADTSRKRNHMGTGLNLAIAYALVKLMGGDLTVVSREDRGSEFKLSVALEPAKGMVTDGEAISDLPLSIDDQLAIEPEKMRGQIDKIEGNVQSPVPQNNKLPQIDPPVLETASGPSKPFIDLMQPRTNLPTLHDVPPLDLPIPLEGVYRVLIVDDMEPNRDILRLMLESQGHICEEAPGGIEGLALLSERPFDLVILDVHMAPLDGVEVLERIRGSNMAFANIPVIALTADNAPSTNAACMEAGADLFLTKPVRQGELVRAFKYLHKTAGSRILSRA